MRPRYALALILASAAVAGLAVLFLGPLEGLSITCALVALWCGTTLYLTTRSARQQQTPLPQGTHATLPSCTLDESASALQPAANAKTAPEPASTKPPQQAPAREDKQAEEQSAPVQKIEAVHIASPQQCEDKDEAKQGEEDAPTIAPAPSQAFDFDAFRRALLLSSTPLTTLREIVDDIRSRAKSDDDTVAPAEEFLERELTASGLFDDSIDAGRVSVVFLRHAKMFYLRISKRSVTYGSFLHLLRMESTLNALLLAREQAKDFDSLQLEDLYALRQRITNSVCAQAPSIDTADWSYLAMPWQVPYGPSAKGEWSVREALSTAIETVRLPYRLEASFRCNVAEGDVALEFMATPGRMFPKTAFVQALGLVPTTRHMRDREASKYTARIGLLMASHTFRTSERIRRVWVSAVCETPLKHSCLYSVCFDRRAFSHVRLDNVSDPLAVLRSFGASMRVADEALQPTTPLFYLEDDRFCPPHRHDLWQLSERSLSPDVARSLGCTRVSGLAIHEQLERDVAADAMLRSLQLDSGMHRTQQSVQSVMSTAQATSDLSVWSAAERVASKLVDGSLESDQLEAIREEFVEGDPLSQAVKTSQHLLMTQHPQDAFDILRESLRPLEDEGRYVDSTTIAYRSFDSFTERVMYNRLNRGDERTVVLVPDAYPVAHLTLSALYSSASNADEDDLQTALLHAKRALDVAPLSASTNLSVAACLEALDKTDEAVEVLRSFLSVAYTAQSMGMAYFRLASLMWRKHDKDAARACYYQAARTFPPLFPFIVTEYQLLAAQAGESADAYDMNEEQVARALQHANIPLAPTQETAYALYDGATASVDGEVFPVAHDLLASLEALTGDDIIHGIRMSLEHEPDA